LAEGQKKKKKVYRTFFGVVQFPPRDGEAGGKAVRNIAIRTTGVKEQSMRISATLWPSHAHVDVQEGDAVVVEGSFEVNKGENKETGEAVTYFNVSVSGILNLGPLDFGEETERTTTRTAAEPETDAEDDIPY
jgi:hypothetical protein